MDIFQAVKSYITADKTPVSVPEACPCKFLISVFYGFFHIFFNTTDCFFLIRLILRINKNIFTFSQTTLFHSMTAGLVAISSVAYLPHIG